MASFLDYPQLQHLLDSVGRHFGHTIATSTDFEILSLDIERETGDHLSASTLKRLWGYVSLHPVPRVATLDVLSRYIGFKSFQEFCQSLKNDGNEVSGFFGTSCISVKDLREKFRPFLKARFMKDHELKSARDILSKMERMQQDDSEYPELYLQARALLEDFEILKFKRKGDDAEEIIEEDSLAKLKGRFGRLK